MYYGIVINYEKNRVSVKVKVEVKLNDEVSVL